jgi:DNA mismatch repair protein MutS
MPKADDTPLMRQWREVKSRNRDSLLFFRVGDFYELFYGDAEEGSRLLGLTLTSRNNGAAARVPLAGVPAKALDDYLGRLVKLGQKVAICDQVEDPAEAQGIVRREVTETVTPGTVLHDTLLTAKRNNFLVALTEETEQGVGVATLDLSTGELSAQAVPPAELRAELGRRDPTELLLPRSLEDVGANLSGGTDAAPGVLRTYRDDWVFDYETAADELKRRYGVQSLDAFGFQKDDDVLVRATGALLTYVAEIRPGGVEHLRTPQIIRPGSAMLLDEMTRRNLELVEPLHREGRASDATLLNLLDTTRTPMGSRLLRQWLLAPLVDVEAICARHDAVEVLVLDLPGRDRLQDGLDGVRDIERLAGRAAGRRASPRDMGALRDSLSQLPDIQNALDTLSDRSKSAELESIAAAFDQLAGLHALLFDALVDRPPVTLGDSDSIKPGFNKELDEVRELRDGGKQFIAGLQTRERERTGIPSLKVGFNRVFGYYIEITKTHRHAVPADYDRCRRAGLDPGTEDPRYAVPGSAEPARSDPPHGAAPGHTRRARVVCRGRRLQQLRPAGHDGRNGAHAQAMPAPCGGASVTTGQVHTQ